MSQQDRNPNQQLQRNVGGGGLSRTVSGSLTRLEDKEETRQLVTWNPEEAVAWIEEASQKGHVVTPSMMPVFPHGRGVAVSVVRVKNFDKYGSDIYPITGSSNLGLHKNILDDIGRGYGIDWPPQWTFREPFTLPGAETEDPRDKDPYCIKITVCGRYKRFDGTWTTLPPLTKEIDLRDGSAEVLQILQTQEAKALKDLPDNATEQAIANAKAFGLKKAQNEINQLRKFIRAHAQTKARLQVIGTLVRRSYTLEELKKPFYVFSSVWTGRSENPKIDMMLAQGALEMEKEGRALLYGGTGTADPKQLPPVEDKPYNADAELVEYEKAMAVAEGGEGGGGDEGSQAKTAGQPEPEKKKCTPEKCYGKNGRHVKACLDEVDEQTEPAAEPWVITHGSAKGQKINDESKVTPEVLAALRTFFDMAIEDDDTPPLKKQELASEKKFVEEEIKRRGLFEYSQS